MRAILDHCHGGTRREAPAGTLVLHEGSKTGHLFVLLEGRLEVIKGDAVVAVLTEPGAVLGEMSVLLDQPHTATVRAASASAKGIRSLQKGAIKVKSLQEYHAQCPQGERMETGGER